MVEYSFMVILVVMKIEHVRQPSGSRLCGQSVVAMILGVPLEESVSRFDGHTSGTRTRMLCDVLRDNGVSIPENAKLKVIRKGDLPEFGILKITWKIPGRKISHGHWILKVGDVIHDPELDGPATIKAYDCWLPKVNGKITSYLELPINVDQRKSLS